MQKGEIIGRDNSRCLVFAWEDNRTVRIITTKHTMEMLPIRRRRKAVNGGGWEEIQKMEWAWQI